MKASRAICTSKQKYPKAIMYLYIFDMTDTFEDESML
jgi:hypothetical protein